MKKHLLLLTLVIAIFASCKKEAKFDATAQAAKDETAIQAYLAANPSIHATKDPSGVYYSNVTDGTGANPKASSIVTVNYVGKLLNDAQFDAGTGFAANLSGNIIEGWKSGLLHGKAGGRILLIIPSGLAYGNTSPSSKVPENSVLIFTIDVLSINN
jgi:FKBP-type peptidyl-prolyl cis-trans isomerase FkpA